MANVANSVPITSKTFKNYLTNRDRKVEQDKNHIEKLNAQAFKRVKHEKLAEKEAKTKKEINDHRLNKVQERVNLNKKNYETNMAEISRESNAAWRTHIRNVEERV